MPPVTGNEEFSVKRELRGITQQKAALVSVSINSIEDAARRLERLGWTWAPNNLRAIADELKAEKGQTW
ncbi:MAG TPA: hypothetical protein VG275_00375 [Solirubrobacteraceae bacterium]|jgi:hypothetical protein|nr:hypothetical protein [Solirubrobacteraceae bacterium]